MKFPLADVEAEVPRFDKRSWRKVVRDGVVVEVVFAVVPVVDELLAESVETRLLKSDSRLLAALFAEEAVEGGELLEAVPSWEINCWRLLEKFEYGEAAVALAAVVEEEVEEVEEADWFESDSDSTAAKRSCINFPNACLELLAEPVGLAEVASTVEVEAFEATGFCGCVEAPGWEGIEMPIWLSACMMLCMSVSFPPEFD